jgi:Zn-dependent membrane protease YugP
MLEEKMFFMDYTWFLVIPPLILAVYAQARVRSTYKRYSQVGASSRLTAAEVARQILNSRGAQEVKVDKIPGRLSDNYDPRSKVLHLSEGVYDSNSLAALGIAAHEAGHAIQHHNHYSPLAIRNVIYPVANIGSTLAFPLFFIGLITSQKRGPSLLMDLGILLFAGAVLFSVITLPVEFNASRQALAVLKERGYLNQTEMTGARKVLSAAALTYVAATAMAVMQLVRMLLIRSSRD